MLQERNFTLYGALKTLTIDVLRLMKDLFPNGENAHASVEFKWVRHQEGDSFFRQLNHRSQSWVLIFQSMPTIRDRDAYRQAEKLVQEDLVWGFHIGKLVGSPMGSRQMNIEDVLMSASSHIVREKESFDFSDATFVENVEEFERFATSATIEHVRITPFYGVTLQEKISLTKEVSIEPLDDPSLQICLNIGMIPVTFSGSGGDTIIGPPRAAVVTRVLLDKTIREETDAIDYSFSNPWEKHIATESKALELLSLLLSTPMSPIGSVAWTTGVANVGYQFQHQVITNPWAPKSTPLSIEQATRFRLYWPIISEESRKSRHFLAIGLRRFALAMSRQLPDDKLIDLMICAEALFLKIDKNELTFRLAFNAAQLLGEGPVQKREVFNFFKKAYAMRSTLVHGSKSYLDNAKDSQELSHTANRLGEYLQTSIQKMLVLAHDPHAPAGIVDWESLMFSAPSNEFQLATPNGNLVELAVLTSPTPPPTP